MDRAAVLALYPRRDGPATGAGSGGRCCMQGEGTLIGNSDLHHLQVLIEKVWKGGHRVLLG